MPLVLFVLTTMLAAGGALQPGGTDASAPQVRTSSGMVEGLSESGVRAFRGIPFAAPPVGGRRWQAPQPAPAWKGVRKTTAFGSRCPQGPIFSDMNFRDEPSEDCLFLNVWTPASSATARLPVMVWIYGGGFQAGSTSEPRQDGTRLAQKDVVVVSMNYRVGVFGFLAHPELTRESDPPASGNYGLLDQVAALRWVRDNIAAFGGDPDNVTIFGESAGSFSVSALMASPLARGLFHRAIGESGAYFTAGPQTLALGSLADAEKAGAEFAASVGADSLAALRSRPVDEILKASLGGPRLRFAPILDGHLLPRDLFSVFGSGAQARVPLLAGWNADEIRASVVLAKQRPTVARFAEQVRTRFGAGAEALLKVYPAATDQEAIESAAALAGDLFVGYATWKWLEMHAQTGGPPVYRYSFDRDIPVAPDTKVMGVAASSTDIGARHAGEIEYVFGTLDSLPEVPWEAADRSLSDLMMSYWTNFARTGNPNGEGLAEWPGYGDATAYQVMHLDATSHAAPDTLRPRYELLDTFTAQLRKASSASP